MEFKSSDRRRKVSRCCCCGYFQYQSWCTFNIISGAAVDYGGNSIGVGLVTWVFLSASPEPRSSPRPWDSRQGEQHPLLKIFSNHYCSSADNHPTESHQCCPVTYWIVRVDAGNPWSHSYLAMDTICPILAPLSHREEGSLAVGSGFVSVRVFARLGRMLFEWWVSRTKVASTAGVEAGGCKHCWH